MGLILRLGGVYKTRAIQNTYSAFLQRVTHNAGPRANFKITVQAVSSEMARITAEAQYPGYKCANAPVPVR